MYVAYSNNEFSIFILSAHAAFFSRTNKINVLFKSQNQLSNWKNDNQWKKTP